MLYYHQCGLLARDALRPFDAAAQRQPVRRGRRRARARNRGRGARAQRADRSAKCSAAATSAKRPGCSRSATTATALRARSTRRSTTPASRTADVGMIVAHGNGTRAVRRVGSRGAAARVRRRDCRRSPRFKWAIGHLIAARGHRRDDDRARGAAQRRPFPASQRFAALDPRMRGAAAVAATRKRRAATSRWSCAGDSRAPMPRCSCARRALDRRDERVRRQRPAPIRCGIDTVEIARIERLLARYAAARPRQDFLGAGARRQRQRRRTRGEPRGALRREGGVRQAVSARARGGTNRACRFFRRRATVTARRRSSAARTRRESSIDARIAGHRRFADARPDERVGGGARAADADDRAARRASCCTACCRFAAASSSRTCGACSAPRCRRRDRAARAGALRAPVAARRRVPALPLAFRRSASGARARRERRKLFADAFARGKGVLRADRPFRQLGGRHGRRHPELSRGARAIPFRAPPDQAALARRAGHPALQHSRIRRDRQARVARRGSSTRLERGDVVVFPVRPVRRRRRTASTSNSSASRPGRSRVLRSSRSQPARRCCPPPAGASRTAAMCCGSRTPLPVVDVDEHERGDPPHDARLQRGARAAGAAPSGAMVVGASPVEVGARKRRSPATRDAVAILTARLVH